MKHKFLVVTVGLCSTFLSKVAQGQDYSIPYLKEKKYNLINNQGNKVLDHTYDKLEWIGSKYFIAKEMLSNIIEPLEYQGTIYHRSYHTVYQSDLIYNNKIILAATPFRVFEVLDETLILGKVEQFNAVKDAASLSKYHIKPNSNYVIFNNKGKQIINSSFNYIGHKLIKDANGITQHIIIKTELDDVQELFLYDTKTQNISQNILPKANKIYIDDYNTKTKSIRCELFDAQNKKKQYDLLYDGKSFKAKLIIPQPKETPEIQEQEYVTSINIFDDNIAVPSPDPIREEKPNPGQKPEIIAQPFSFIAIKDTVYMYRPGMPKAEWKQLGVQHDTLQYIVSGNYQNRALLLKKGNKYAIQNANAKTDFQYSFAKQLGNNLIQVKNFEGKEGIINAEFKEVIPVKQDSIMIIKQTISDAANGFKTSNNQAFRRFGEENYFGVEDYYSIFKDGKVKLYNRNFIPLMDTIFDAFYLNSASNYSTATKQNNQYLAIMNGQYYYVENFMKYKPIQFIGPFPGYPIFRYENYYGIKGFTLYEIYDDSLKYNGYCERQGQIIELK